MLISFITLTDNNRLKFLHLQHVCVIYMCYLAETKRLNIRFFKKVFFNLIGNNTTLVFYE
jgi:hypothetical protein